MNTESLLQQLRQNIQTLRSQVEELYMIIDMLSNENESRIKEIAQLKEELREDD